VTSFHQRLKEARRERKVSIRRLCRDLKINKATYENWEMGVCPSRPELYKRLADYLEVPLEYLISGERKHTEWERTIMHLRKYVEEAIEARLRAMLAEQRAEGRNMLG
jgi:transcriptional regulator with XRE-family HTH domain